MKCELHSVPLDASIQLPPPPYPPLIPPLFLSSSPSIANTLVALCLNVNGLSMVLRRQVLLCLVPIFTLRKYHKALGGETPSGERMLADDAPSINVPCCHDLLSLPPPCLLPPSLPSSSLFNCLSPLSDLVLDLDSIVAQWWEVDWRSCSDSSPS